MKVVLFAGGLGLRLRDYDKNTPKPMVPISHRPVLWHVMRYYAYWGFKDFVLCLGYRADAIKEYFLRYNEALTNDFVLSRGGRQVELLSTDIQDWCITFVDTGLHANLGQRLLAVRHHLQGEEIFCANYGDVLTDAPLGELLDDFKRRGKVAAFLCVRPSYPFRVVKMGEGGRVAAIEDVRRSDVWINGGYFFFREELFDYVRPGEELVVQPFRRLIAERELVAYRYEGFWASMDTLRELQDLEARYERGEAPWALWRANGAGAVPGAVTRGG